MPNLKMIVSYGVLSGSVWFYIIFFNSINQMALWFVLYYHLHKFQVELCNLLDDLVTK